MPGSKSNTHQQKVLMTPTTSSMSASGGGGGAFPPSTVVRIVSVTLSTTFTGLLSAAFALVVFAVRWADDESSSGPIERVTAV